MASTLIDVRMRSREPPSQEADPRAARRSSRRSSIPALMHCKSGADRAGVDGGALQALQDGPADRARRSSSSSLKYLHVKQGKTGMIDFFFATYLEETKASGKPFLQWVDEDYDQERVKAAFIGQWWANILVDRILRRE